jgi:hypothetical protein
MTVRDKILILLREVAQIFEEHGIEYYFDMRGEGVLRSSSNIPTHLDSLALLIRAEDAQRAVALLRSHAGGREGRALCAFPDTKYYPACLIRYCDTDSLYRNLLIREKYDPPGLHINILLLFPNADGFLAKTTFHLSTVAMLARLDPGAYSGRSLFWSVLVMAWRLFFSGCNRSVQDKFMRRAARVERAASTGRFFYDVFGRRATTGKHAGIRCKEYDFDRHVFRLNVMPAVSDRHRLIKPKRLPRAKVLGPAVSDRRHVTGKPPGFYRSFRRRMWTIRLISFLAKKPFVVRDRYLALAFRSADRISFYFELIGQKDAILEKSGEGDFRGLHRLIDTYVDAVVYYLDFDLALCFDYEIYVAVIDMFLAFGLRDEARRMAELLPLQHIDDIAAKYDRYKSAEEMDSLSVETEIRSGAREMKDELVRSVHAACETGFFSMLDRTHVAEQDIPDAYIEFGTLIRSVNYYFGDDEELSDEQDDEPEENAKITYAIDENTLDRIACECPDIVAVDFRDEPYELYELKKKIGLFHIYCVLAHKRAVFFIDSERLSAIRDPREDEREVEHFDIFDKIVVSPDTDKIRAYVGCDAEWIAAFTDRQKTAVLYHDEDIRRTVERLG